MVGGGGGWVGMREEGPLPSLNFGRLSHNVNKVNLSLLSYKLTEE